MDPGLRGKTVVVVGRSSNLRKACTRNATQEGTYVIRQRFREQWLFYETFKKAILL